MHHLVTGEQTKVTISDVSELSTIPRARNDTPQPNTAVTREAHNRVYISAAETVHQHAGINAVQDRGDVMLTYRSTRQPARLNERTH
jgi:hypothetical protein